jgi:hypothetical protein
MAVIYYFAYDISKLGHRPANSGLRTFRSFLLTFAFLLLIGLLPSANRASSSEPNETKNQKAEPNTPASLEPNVPTPVQPNERASSIEPNQPKPISEPNTPPLHEPNVPTPVQPNERASSIEPNQPKPVSEPNTPSLHEPNVPAPVEPNERASSTEPNQPKSKPTPTRVSFHDKFVEFFKTYVNDNGMVNYKALKRKRPELKNLLDEFAHLDPNEYSRWPKEDKIAFWLNAYNLQMLKIITDNYPIQGSRWLNPFYGPNSIRHIKGIWTDYKFIVMDEEFTLTEVDQRFFRKEFAEPTVFFALSHASLSSPPLGNEPYYGDKLHQQLQNQTKRFLANPLAFRIDRQNKKVYLSAIFQEAWHGKEFITKFGTNKKFKDQDPVTRAVLNFITNYLARQDIDFLEVENYSIKYIKYDWTINDSSQNQ